MTKDKALTREEARELFREMTPEQRAKFAYQFDHGELEERETEDEK